MTTLENIRSNEKEQVAFSLPKAIIARVDELAADETISRSAWLRRLVVGATKANHAAD